MQGEQGLGLLLLQPRAVEGQVADLLPLGVQQEGSRARRRHVGPRRGPDAGRRDAGETWHRAGLEGEKRIGDGSKRLLASPLRPKSAARGGLKSPRALLLHGGGLPGSERVPWISLPLSSTHQQYPLSPWHCSGVKWPPVSHWGTYWSPRGLPP